jgi:hypothetical protein
MEIQFSDGIAALSITTSSTGALQRPGPAMKLRHEPVSQH